MAERGITYQSTPENLGLSVIYNRVIADSLRDGEYLLLLDQDSVLPNDYLALCEAAAQAHPDIDLLLPMVRANDRWVSPLTYFSGWGRYWPEPRRGRIPSTQVSAINSGMVISSRYLKTDFPGYDERLRFYGTDTQFMLCYQDQRSQLVVLEGQIGHDLSFFSEASGNRASKFKAMRDAYAYIYESRPWWERLGVRLVMLAVSLTYAARYRDKQFLEFRS